MPGYYNTATDATLSGRIEIAPRVSAADMHRLPAFSYVKVVLEYGNPDDGYVAVVLPGDEAPLSTASVAREVRELIDLFPGHEFNGVLDRQAGEKFGGAISRIGVLGRSVRF